ncbi:hypothetical protein [Photobacterium sanguinicancri]|uniref:Peptidase M12A domain-containing protein n=2 Tax=Photobacterium sanguinicancri TaxID=875932 RepID=A0AAW7Y3B5_9GAMM|nr:hypothetical protein [Photobacterium sanguinicancri]KXI22445.1 hypothetical protein AS132_12475 [Photobacterium sanguinicancri]MDO6542246.1 hypothetical protein [Photobacterium sanguinicancri]
MKKLSIIVLASIGIFGCNMAIAANNNIEQTEAQAAPSVSVDPAKDFLSQLGLSQSDVEMLYKYHHNTVMSEFRNRDNLLFGNVVPLKNTSFMPANTIGNMEIGTGYHLVNWDQQSIAEFKDTLGRVVFLMNTPEFRRDFNRSIFTVRAQSSENVLIPSSYDQLKSYVNQTAARYGNHVTAYVSDSHTQRAWGTNRLFIQFEQSGINAALVAHEMMHGVGFAHDGKYTGWNDNIPYYVQTILSMNESASDICKNGRSKCEPDMINFGEFYNSDDNETYRPANRETVKTSVALLGKYFNHVS